MRFHYNYIYRMEKELERLAQPKRELSEQPDFQRRLNENKVSNRREDVAEKHFYTTGEYEAAARVNILDYLKAKGYGFENEGRYFRSKEHSSLVIRTDGFWNWNKYDEHGNSTVTLLSKLLQTDQGYDNKTAYIQAVKNLAHFGGFAEREERENFSPGGREVKKTETGTSNPPGEKWEKTLQMPEKSTDYKRAIAYLCKTRKIDYDIVKKLIAEKKIIQEAKTNNVGFVAYDEDGQAKHIFLRGTMSDKSFKKDAPGSDKAYPFTFGGSEESKRVYVFEAAIDALSHATIAKRCGKETGDYRITLNGVSSEGLDGFLKRHKNVKEIVVYTDNDEAGEKCARSIAETKSGEYKLYRQKAPLGKDWNEYLVNHVPEIKPPPKSKVPDMEMEM